MWYTGTILAGTLRKQGEIRLEVKRPIATERSAKSD
jgi:hypothetical protein